MGGEASRKEVAKLELEVHKLSEEWKMKWEEMKEYYQEELYIARKESRSWEEKAEENEAMGL